MTLLRDANGDGKAEFRATFADGFDQPHGLAFHDNALYVADTRAVWRIPYTDGATKGTSRTAVTTPGAFGSNSDHWTRNIVFDSKGRLFIAIGSSANVTEDPPPRATVQMFENGKMRTFASGTRNPVGIAFYPGTDDLYVVVNERDELGDGLVPDYLTHLVEGGFYGWPYAYIGKHPDPKFGSKRPDLVAKSIMPDLLFQSHSAPLGLVFYEGNQFPAAYRGDAFVALHGSWNAAEPTGYKVVHVPFRNGRPAGGYDNFAVGFWMQKTPGEKSSRPHSRRGCRHANQRRQARQRLGQARGPCHRQGRQPACRRRRGQSGVADRLYRQVIGQLQPAVDSYQEHYLDTPTVDLGL